MAAWLFNSEEFPFHTKFKGESGVDIGIGFLLPSIYMDALDVGNFPMLPV